MSKILMISHDAYLYGAQRSLLDVAIGLSNRGHEVHICMPAEGDLANRLRNHNIPVRFLRFGRWIQSSHEKRFGLWAKVFATIFMGTVRACRLLRSERYEAVYTNTVTVLDFALAAKLHRIPHIWHLRESVDSNPQLLSLLNNRSTSRIVRMLSNRVIYNSHHLLARYSNHAKAKDVVIHNGLQPRLATKNRSQPASNDRYVVVTVGFMQPGKGLDVLLDALLLLRDDLRDRILLRVVGDIDKEYMDQAIAPRVSRLGPMVEIMGWIDSASDIIADADLLVSSSHTESFGRTLVEAMLAGVAVLATRSGGPEEIVVDGVTGYLVPPNDPHKLSERLSSLLSDPAQLAALGLAGRERALTHFSLSQCIEKIERCIEHAISEAK